MKTGLSIKLWGIRSSIPAPLDRKDYQKRLLKTVRFARRTWEKNKQLKPEDILDTLPENLSGLMGGDTICMEVLYDDQMIIIGMGTGSRNLGKKIMSNRFSGDMHIVLTGTHWDQIQGWPFFVPAYIPGNRIHFYSCIENCREGMANQQVEYFFPITFDSMLSRKNFSLLNAGRPRKIGRVKLITINNNKNKEMMFIKLIYGNKSFIYACHPNCFSPRSILLAQKGSFFNDVDILFLYQQDWVHKRADHRNQKASTFYQFVENIKKSNIKKIVWIGSDHITAGDEGEDITSRAYFQRLQKCLPEGSPEFILAREEDVFEL